MRRSGREVVDSEAQIKNALSFAWNAVNAELGILAQFYKDIDAARQARIEVRGKRESCRTEIQRLKALLVTSLKNSLETDLHEQYMNHKTQEWLVSTQPKSIYGVEIARPQSDGPVAFPQEGFPWAPARFVIATLLKHEKKSVAVRFTRAVNILGCFIERQYPPENGEKFLEILESYKDLVLKKQSLPYTLATAFDSWLKKYKSIKDKVKGAFVANSIELVVKDLIGYVEEYAAAVKDGRKDITPKVTMEVIFGSEHLKKNTDLKGSLEDIVAEVEDQRVAIENCTKDETSLVTMMMATNPDKFSSLQMIPDGDFESLHEKIGALPVDGQTKNIYFDFVRQGWSERGVFQEDHKFYQEQVVGQAAAIEASGGLSTQDTAEASGGLSTQDTALNKLVSDHCRRNSLPAIRADLEKKEAEAQRIESEINTAEEVVTYLDQKIVEYDAFMLDLIKQQVATALDEYTHKTGMRFWEKTWHGAKGRRFAQTFNQTIQDAASTKVACEFIRDYFDPRNAERKDLRFRDHSFSSYLFRELFKNGSGVFAARMNATQRSNNAPVAGYVPSSITDVNGRFSQFKGLIDNQAVRGRGVDFSANTDSAGLSTIEIYNAQHSCSLFGMKNSREVAPARAKVVAAACAIANEMGKRFTWTSEIQLRQRSSGATGSQPVVGNGGASETTPLLS